MSKAKIKSEYIVKYVERRGKSVRVNMPVAKPLRNIIGKSRLQHSLGIIENDKRAETLASPHVTRFLRQIEDAGKVLAGAMTVDEMALRDRQRGLPEDVAEWLAFERQGELKPEQFERYEGIRKGELIPLRLYESEWLRSLKATAKTEQEFTAHLKTAETFLKTRNRDLVSSVTDADVMAWRDSMLKAGKANATINKRLTAMSSYFGYIMKAGAIDRNPFKGKLLEAEPVRKRRRYTMDEVEKLFKLADAKRRDEMAVALLGLRLAEQWRLQVQHVETIRGVLVIHVPGTKSDAAARDIPVPDALLPVIARLMDGKKPVDYLCEAPVAAKLKSRGAEPGRRYMRWLRSKGFSEAVDWHSWRRTSAWLMETAHVPESTAARLLGHANRLGLSYGLYSGAADLVMLKQAIDVAFKVLPNAVMVHFKAADAS